MPATEHSASRPVRLVVASQNPVKLQAVRAGYSKLFPDRKLDCLAVSVEAGVPDQPMSDQETLSGAITRAQAARAAAPEADLSFGLEGGIEDDGERLCAFAWVVVLDRHGASGRSRSATFMLPAAVADLVRQGEELGIADDRVFGSSNSKQKAGAVGLLTEGAIDRTALYAPAVSLALVRWRRPDLAWS